MFHKPVTFPLKTLFSTILLACTSWLSTNAQSALRITLTPQVRQQIRQCNETAGKAAAYILNESVLGGNIRSQQTAYVTELHAATLTTDSVQVYSNNRNYLGYSPRFNAFIPVRSREEALRLAIGIYKPDRTATNRSIFRRKPDPNGLHAEILIDIREDRTGFSWSENEEEALK